MLTDKSGEAAVPEIERWADRISRKTDTTVDTSVYHDADSSTYVIRLAKASRVLLFRLSEAQVQTPGREAQCEKTLKRKLKDLTQAS